MRIRSLKLVNYRGFKDTPIDLDRPLTVLVGVNGSGKTSVLYAAACACSFVLRRVNLPLLFSWKFEDIDLNGRADHLEIAAAFENGGITELVGATHDRGAEANLPMVLAPALMRMHGAGPFLPVFYVATRDVAHWTRAFQPVAAQPGQTAAADVYDSLNPSEAHGIAFGSLFRWFREREDLENQIKVSKGDLSLEDPQLRAVRKAITGLLLDFSDLRIQRDPLHMVVRKGREELALDQLSHGERLLVAMTADLARRLAIAYHDQPEPLKGEALVLIDEIELHLHVSWQRTVLVRLRAIFPGCQFIVTTHSPQVLSTVPGDAVVLLDNFQVVRPGVQTRGRDSNAILREIFGVEERPSEELTEAREIGDALDRGDVAGARARLEELERRLGWQDSEVIRLKTRLEFLDAPLAEKTSLIFPRFGGRSDYAANAAICDLNSNSIGLT